MGVTVDISTQQVMVDPITLPDLTVAQIGGTGVFDVLMKATKEHLEQEFKLGRIKGLEYATVYLGSLEHVLRASVDFLLQKDKMALDALLVSKQVELAEIEKGKLALEAQLVGKQVELADVEKQKTLAEVAIAQAQLPKIEAEILLTQAQLPKIEAEVLLANAQLPKIDAEVMLANAQLPKIEAEVALSQAQLPKITAEVALAEAQLPKITAEIALSQAQLPKINAEVLLIEAQKDIATQQALKIPGEISHLAAQTTLLGQQHLTEIEQTKTVIAQECKLRAEYDVIMENKLKTAEEKNLLLWKTNTEKAQTLSSGVDPNSIIGKQKELYGAQANGFKRDAEQKAAKIMVDSWNVRRSTDSTATSGNGSNKLDDSYVGQAVAALLSGVGA